MTSSGGTAHVLVVDDHPVFRRGLVGLLETEPWVAAVSEAATVEESVREVVRGRADVVAMDLLLPDGTGIEAVTRIRAVRPTARILMLTMSDDGERVADALRSGAHGYVLKRSEPDDIVAALRTVFRGSVVLGPDVGTGLLLTTDSRVAPPPAPLDRLSDRELRLVRLVAEGLSNAEIARRLGVVEKTIRNQLTPLFDRLDVADRLQAALLVRKLYERRGHTAQ